MEDFPKVHERMHVHGADDEWIGWVSAVGPRHFEVTRLTHPTWFWDVPMDEVAEVQGQRVRLKHGWSEVHLIEEHDGGALPPPGAENIDTEPF
ncbi:MAG: hypothetical protein L0Y66_05320 [Myxococcaceae bacterium]|nr:hypothetical protein [Myxococcaceae bacterium]